MGQFFYLFFYFSWKIHCEGAADLSDYLKKPVLGTFDYPPELGGLKFEATFWTFPVLLFKSVFAFALKFWLKLMAPILIFIGF